MVSYSQDKIVEVVNYIMASLQVSTLSYICAFLWNGWVEILVHSEQNTNKFQFQRMGGGDVYKTYVACVVTVFVHNS